MATYTVDTGYSAARVYTVQTGYTRAAMGVDTVYTRAAYTVDTGYGGTPSVAAPTNVTPPVASGVVRIGEVLSSDDGVWTNSPTGYTYQWTRDNVAIGGEVANTYTTVAADISAQIRCKVTAINAGGSSAPEPSNALTSPWRDIVNVLGVDGYLWVLSDDETGTAAGDPLAAALDVTGAVALEQSLSAARPTQATDHADFVTDDYLTADSLASYWQSGSRSVMVVLQSSINSSAQMLLSVTRVGFASPQWSLSAQGRCVSTTGSVVFAATTLPALKPIWVVDTPSGSERQIDTTVVAGAAIGSSALLSGVTLGARRLGSVGSWLTDGVRAVIFASRELDSTERATIRAALDAAGVTT